MAVNSHESQNAERTFNNGCKLIDAAENSESQPANQPTSQSPDKNQARNMGNTKTDAPRWPCGPRGVAVFLLRVGLIWSDVVGYGAMTCWIWMLDSGFSVFVIAWI